MSPLVSMCLPLQRPKWMRSAATRRSGSSRGRNLLTSRSKRKIIQFLLNSRRGWPGSPNSLLKCCWHIELDPVQASGAAVASCLSLSSISLAAMMQQSSAVKVQLGQSKLHPAFLGPPQACQSAKLDMLPVQKHTAHMWLPSWLCNLWLTITRHAKEELCMQEARLPVQQQGHLGTIVSVRPPHRPPPPVWCGWGWYFSKQARAWS